MGVASRRRDEWFPRLGRPEGDISDDFAYLDKMGGGKDVKVDGPTRLLPSQTRDPDAVFTPYLPREEGDEAPVRRVTPFKTSIDDDFAYLKGLEASPAVPALSKETLAALAESAADDTWRAAVDQDQGPVDVASDRPAAVSTAADAAANKAEPDAASASASATTSTADSKTLDDDRGRLGRQTNFRWNKDTNEATCPPAGAAGVTGAAAGASPLSTFTSLGANFLALGDSTDKLWLLAACSKLLPPADQCDYGNMGIPKVTQNPHNVRPYMCDPERDGAGCDMHIAQCCRGPTEDQCCMTNQEVRTALACGTRHGAAGMLHILGPGAGAYDDPRWNDDVKDYEGYGVPRSTPERVIMALRNFTRWAAYHEPKRGDVALTQAETAYRNEMARQASAAAWKRAANRKGGDEDVAGNAVAAMGIRAASPPAGNTEDGAHLGLTPGGENGGSGPRPTVVVINTNYWAQKFGDPNDEAFYASYDDELAKLVDTTRGFLERARGNGGGGGCVVLRTQHDMVKRDDPNLNAHTRRVNQLIHKVGQRMGVPVFPWDAIMNQNLEKNIFDGWCHQWGDASLYMMKRFASWAAVNLAGDCFERGRGQEETPK